VGRAAVPRNNTSRTTHHDSKHGCIPLYIFINSVRENQENRIVMADFTFLPRDVVVKIFSHLGTPQEVVKCSYLSHDIGHATNEPELWHELAQIKYGKEIADATSHFYEEDWNAMLKDDNCRGALPTLNLFQPCFWRFNNDHDFQQQVIGQDGLFYCCIITRIQWDRANSIVRVNFDARGETDLRHPVRSSLSIRSVDGDSVHSFASARVELSVQQDGHYKGYFLFPQEYFKRNEAYHFCYANMFHEGGDYESIAILTRNLARTAFDHYTLANDQLFENETKEVELARWNQVLPDGFLERRPDWWV